jgi:hypothetical protein
MTPFFVGVTGHRVLGANSIAQARGDVQAQIRRLQGLLRATPIVVLSALAEGADRLVAQVALECDCVLWAVLPTSVENYLEDFESEASREEFHRLLAKSARTINASLLCGRGEDARERPQIYVDLAHQVCRMSHLVIALWDGACEEKPGGTSQVVRKFLTGEFPGAGESVIGCPDFGPVIHIKVSREDARVDSTGPIWLTPRPGGPGRLALPEQFTAIKDFESSLTCLAAFNARLGAQGLHPAQAAEQLLPVAYDWRADGLLSQWLGWFSAAEKVNARAAYERLRNLCAVVLLFVVFTLATLAYGGLVTRAWPLLVGIFALGTAAAVYAWHRVHDIDELWVGSRAFAEFLRVGIVLRTAGCEQRVHHVASEEGVFSTDWVGIAVRAIDILASVQPATGGAASEPRSVIDFWCKQQQDYFFDGANKIAHHARLARKYGLLSAACIGFALLVYLLTWLIDVGASGAKREQVAFVTAWSMYIYWGLLSLAAVVASISQIIGHAQHELDYQFALVKFRIATRHLGVASGLVAPQLAAQLGRAALREVVLWLKVHRARPLRLPF